MNEKKGTRSDVAASKRAKMEAGTEQATTSKSHDITSTSPGQELHIADFLSHGPENGVTLRHLKTLTNLPGREIRRQIERERRSGCPIVSDCRRGYWLAETQTEIETFCRSMRARAAEIQRTAAAVEAGASD